MDYRTLVNKLEAIQRGPILEAAIANPYKDPAQAAMFNAMSDADQEWLTRGGGVPDITDKYILMRAPNKGQPDPAKAAAKQKTQADTTSDAFIKEKLAKLAELVGKLQAGRQSAKPATMPAQATSIEQAKALGAANPQFEGSTISKDLIESFGYQTTDEGVAGAALKAGGKGLARALPGVGLALGGYDAYNRIKAGDYTGAAIAGAGGLASLVPGIGTAAALGLAGAQAGRDKARTGSFLPDDDEIKAAAAKGQAPATTQAAKPAGNLGIKQMQKELGVAPDGAIGPNTKAAMAKNPTLAAKYGFGPDGSVLPKAASVAESMASLRDRLAMIETEQQVDEDWRADALKFGANAVKGAKFGFTNPTMAKNLTQASHSIATKGGRLVGRGGAAIARNPGRAGLGLAALGAGTAYAANSKPTGTTPPVKPPSTPTQGGKPTPDSSTTNATADPELIKQIQAVMGEIADIETPEVIAALQNAQSAIEGKPTTAAAPVTQAAKPTVAPAPQSNFGTGK